MFALGGGVVGDMTGFAAACYMRGVPFVRVPTTLLAQVDSSVGGKTAINSAAGKNMVGAFHQPALVLIDPDLLSTLPTRQLAAGFAEVVKYGLIDDLEFFDYCDAHLERVFAGDADVRAQAIIRSVQSKARIVAADETERTGTRALLNLGHTFGHALEADTGFSDRLFHGEAVAAGGEVRGAVEWIDDPAGLARAADEIEKARILLDGLLAHDWDTRQDPRKARRQPVLGRDIGHGDDVARPLLADIILGEIAETRQQLRRRRLAHEFGDPFRAAGVEHRPQPTTPNRSSSFRIT